MNNTQFTPAKPNPLLNNVPTVQISKDAGNDSLKNGAKDNKNSNEVAVKPAVKSTELKQIQLPSVKRLAQQFQVRKIL